MDRYKTEIDKVLLWEIADLLSILAEKAEIKNNEVNSEDPEDVLNSRILMLNEMIKGYV
jgi:hypothetical protein